MIIKESQIEEQKLILEHTRRMLANDVKKFTHYEMEIEEVLMALRMCLNTSGGEKRIQKIGSVEFDTKILNEIVENLEEIKVEYKKIKQNL